MSGGWGIDEVEKVNDFIKKSEPILKTKKVIIQGINASGETIEEGKIVKVTSKEGVKPVEVKPVEVKKELIKYNFNDKTKIRDTYLWLLYGASSSGKSYTALTFPGNTIIIDTEDRAEITKRECFNDKKIHIFKPKVLLEKVGPNGEVIDYKASIDNLSSFILDLVKDIKEKKVDVKTVIVDSMSDVWNWAINWAMLKLVDKVNRNGSKKVDIDMLHFNNQMNWFMPKNKHYNLFQILKVLTNYGVNVVFTARNKEVPEYVKKEKRSKLGKLYTESFSEKIRCEKNLPFDCDIIVRQTLTSENKRMSIVEKSYKNGVNNKVIENLTYEKLKEVLK